MIVIALLNAELPASGGSTLGPGGHRPPKSCPGPPKFLDTVVLLLVELIGSNNIIIAVIGLVGLTRAPECIKMHNFEGEMPKFFWAGAQPHPTPLGRGIPPPQTPPPSTPSAPPFECLRHSTSRTTFLDTGLGARPPKYFFLEPPLNLGHL